METRRVVKIGFDVKAKYLFSEETLHAFLSSYINVNGRVLFLLRDYLLEHSKIFDDVVFRFTDESSRILSNGTLTGLVGEINRSEIDIGIRPINMNDHTLGLADFSYPYYFFSVAFGIQKPESTPQIFGIFQTFSLTLWITIISILFALSLCYYVIFMPKYPFSKILLHIHAVFLRQNSIFRSSSSAENLLVYSWVVGAMFICLAYDSVFLSFLAFPPVTPIRDLSDLVKAVKKGDYHCFTPPASTMYTSLLQSEQENLKIIAKDILTNNMQYREVFAKFYYETENVKLAFLVDSANVPLLNVGKKFISEDRFLEFMNARIVRKNFCCKKLLEMFEHRMIASGMYQKFENDRNFKVRMPLLFKFSERDNGERERKLNLVDVAPAFIFLVTGYFTSFLIFSKELLVDRRRKKA